MDKYEEELQLRDLYIINKELLGKSGKPILWIPVPREKNARQWSSFYSRSNDNLNIPYMYLTIKSIIEKCSDTFTICVIDDDSFAKLLPNWTPELDKIGDPLREKVRYLGMIELLYHYGGVLVPPSFLCLRNLDGLWNSIDNKPFIVENVNYYGDERFAVDPYFLASKRECPAMKDFADYLALMITNDYTAESIFLNDISKWCARRCQMGVMTTIDANMVGVKNQKGEAIITEKFFEQQRLDLRPDIYGILIPHEQILKRTNLNWLCYLEKDELVKIDTDLGHYFSRTV